ncbi:diguanylate cyclase [candidate division WOR-3 bacterium]|nr:diguanylate cyclase [candidate division WOR-3 bacterium]
MDLDKPNMKNLTPNKNTAKSPRVILVQNKRVKESEIKRLLSERGFEVLPCDNIFDTLDKLKSPGYTAGAVFDVDELSGDAMEILEAIRSEKSKTEFPVALITNRKDFDIEDFFRSGANEYIERSKAAKEFVPRFLNLVSTAESFRSLLKNSDKIKFLFETSNIFNSTLDIDVIMDHILKLTVEATNSHSGTVFLTDAKGNVIKQILSNNYPSPLQQSVIVDKIMHKGLAGWVFENKKPGIISNTDTDERWYKMKWNGPDLKSVVCMPMIRRDHILGVLTLHHPEESYYNENHIEILNQIANQAAISIENSHIFNQLHHLSITDELTGLFNRRLFFTLADKEYFKAIKFNEFLSMMMIDIDDFKSINDVYGHFAGDIVLETISKIFQTIIRNYDILARYGGDEFVVLMPKTHIQGAIDLAKKIHKEVECCEIKVDEKKIRVTLSIGVAEKDDKTDSFSHLLKKTDQALYRAKAKGKNRIDITC